MNLFFLPTPFAKCNQALYKCKDDLQCRLSNPGALSYTSKSFSGGTCNKKEKFRRFTEHYLLKINTLLKVQSHEINQVMLV